MSAIRVFVLLDAIKNPRAEKRIKISMPACRYLRSEGQMKTAMTMTVSEYRARV